MTKIELKPQFERFVEEQLAAGRFRNADEVVEAALRLLQDRDADRAAALADVRRKIQESLDDPRPSIPAEEVFAELERKFARLRGAGE